MMTTDKPRGSISALVVCLVMGAFSLTGLAFDGGRVVATYMELSDAAQNAARLGGQQVVGIRDGDPRVDPTASTSVMNNYLSVRGLRGSFSVADDVVVVRVQQRVSMRILGLFGVGDRLVSASRTAEVVSG
jgi:hypothetical protein